MDHSQAVALCFLEAYTLSRNNMDEVLKDYPEQAAVVHRAATRMLVQRSLMRYLVGKMAESGDESKIHGPRSFVPRANASGFTLAANELTLEQKLDHLLRANGVAIESGASLNLASLSKPNPPCLSRTSSGADLGAADPVTDPKPAGSPAGEQPQRTPVAAQHEAGRRRAPSVPPATSPANAGGGVGEALKQLEALLVGKLDALSARMESVEAAVRATT